MVLKFFSTEERNPAIYILQSSKEQLKAAVSFLRQYNKQIPRLLSFHG